MHRALLLLATFVLSAGACATTHHPSHASCLAMVDIHYDKGGANPCGYDAGSQAQEPSGP